MGLAETQRLLARISTDADLRGRFAADPLVVGAEFGLSPLEAENLKAVPMAQLDEFAASLIRKRRNEVESLLPLTFQALGAAHFARLFRRHVAAYLPTGIKKHRDDAVAFASFLQHEVGENWKADLARMEAANLLAHDPARRWHFLWLDHHPSELARATVTGSEPPRFRRCWIVWCRPLPNGRVHRLILSRPR
jgi:hypothetical protein